MKKKKEVIYAIITAMIQTSIIIYPTSPLINVTNSNQIGKNGIPEAELTAGSTTD